MVTEYQSYHAVIPLLFGLSYLGKGTSQSLDIFSHCHHAVCSCLNGEVPWIIAIFDLGEISVTVLNIEFGNVRYLRTSDKATPHRKSLIVLSLLAKLPVVLGEARATRSRLPEGPSNLPVQDGLQRCVPGRARCTVRLWLEPFRISRLAPQNFFSTPIADP